MKRTLLLALLLLAGAAAAAQPRIRVERRENNSVDFFLDDKDFPGTCTVFLTLKNLRNCDGPMQTQQFEVRSDGMRLLTLRPVNDRMGIGFSYAVAFFRGRLDPPVDTAFVYRMPCTTQRPVQVSQGRYVLDRFRKDSEKRGRLGTHFALERGDTVYAARRGTVVRVQIAEKRPDDAPQISFSSKSTTILAEHSDGSYAWYVGLDGEHLFVEEGADLLPGTPLGLVGSYDGERYSVSVQFMWNRRMLDEGEHPRTERVHFFPPFLTQEGVLVPEHDKCYTAVMDESLLTREMTRKELKRFGGQKADKKK